MDSTIRNQFKAESLEQLKALKPSDVEIFSDISQLAPFVTIVAFPGETIKKKIIEIISELKRIDPAQLYYEPDQLHLTILGNLPANIPDELVKSAVKKCLPAGMAFNVEDLACNSRGPSVCLYPKKHDLKAIRDNLREELGVKGDDYTSFINTYEHMAWINFARFLQQPRPEVLDFFLRNKTIQLGEMELDGIYYCRANSRILQSSNCTRIV